MYVSSYITVCFVLYDSALPGVASWLKNTHGDVENNTAFTINCERYALSCKIYSYKK